MNRNNNISLFEKTVIDLLKNRKNPMSVSDISVELKHRLIEKELPPKGYFLNWMSKIEKLSRDDTIKKDMPFFSYKNDVLVDNKVNINEEHLFFKKYKFDFYKWLKKFQNYKQSNVTSYSMWDDLKKDYDICLENLKIIKSKYPQLLVKISDLKLKKMPVEVDNIDSSKTIKIIYKLDQQKNLLLPRLDRSSLPKLDLLSPPKLDLLSPPGLDLLTPPELDILTPPGLDLLTSPELDILTPPKLDLLTPPKLDLLLPPGLNISPTPGLNIFEYNDL